VGYEIEEGKPETKRNGKKGQRQYMSKGKRIISQLLI